MDLLLLSNPEQNTQDWSVITAPVYIDGRDAKVGVGFGHVIRPKIEWKKCFVPRNSILLKAAVVGLESEEAGEIMKEVAEEEAVDGNVEMSVVIFNSSDLAPADTYELARSETIKAKIDSNGKLEFAHHSSGILQVFLKILQPSLRFPDFAGPVHSIELVFEEVEKEATKNIKVEFNAETNEFTFEKLPVQNVYLELQVQIAAGNGRSNAITAKTLVKVELTELTERQQLELTMFYVRRGSEA